MRLRELPVKKHIHSWVLVNKKLAPSGWYLQRACSAYECRRAEAGYMEHPEISEYPASLLANADIDWRLGAIDDVYPNAEEFFTYFHGMSP